MAVSQNHPWIIVLYDLTFPARGAETAHWSCFEYYEADVRNS